MTALPGREHPLVDWRAELVRRVWVGAHLDAARPVVGKPHDLVHVDSNLIGDTPVSLIVTVGVDRSLVNLRLAPPAPSARHDARAAIR